MPLSLKLDEAGRYIIVRAFGELVSEDYRGFAVEFNRLVRARGNLHVLVDMTGLQGWNPGGLWEEVKFDVKHFAEIDRLAVVGDKKWQQAMTVAAKPFRPGKMRYFDRSEMGNAEAWVAEGRSPAEPDAPSAHASGH
ncbi:MAG TPA: STAS/SEC14 domain-containing protein [Terracidiphilus sp.]|nr:STAS/SEC14 domain-containing protein [Terracidiphilus sp.]